MKDLLCIFSLEFCGCNDFLEVRLFIMKNAISSQVSRQIQIYPNVHIGEWRKIRKQPNLLIALANIRLCLSAPDVSPQCRVRGARVCFSLTQLYISGPVDALCRQTPLKFGRIFVRFKDSVCISYPKCLNHSEV